MRPEGYGMLCAIIPMRRALPFCLALILQVACIPSTMGSKVSDSDWQSGVVKRISTNHVLKTSGHYGEKPPKHGVFFTYYFIEANNYLFEAEEIQTKPSKTTTLTVDEPVKFIVNGTEFSVKDKKGKQHKFRLLNSIPESSSQPAAPK